MPTRINPKPKTKEYDFLCNWDFCTSCIAWRKKMKIPGEILTPTTPSSGEKHYCRKCTNIGKDDGSCVKLNCDCKCHIPTPRTGDMGEVKCYFCKPWKLEPGEVLRICEYHATKSNSCEVPIPPQSWEERLERDFVPEISKSIPLRQFIRQELEAQKERIRGEIFDSVSFPDLLNGHEVMRRNDVLSLPSLQSKDKNK